MWWGAEVAKFDVRGDRTRRAAHERGPAGGDPRRRRARAVPAKSPWHPGHREARRHAGEIGRSKVKRDEVMHLSRQLSAFVRAGLPLIEAVHTLGVESGNPKPSKDHGRCRARAPPRRQSVQLLRPTPADLSRLLPRHPAVGRAHRPPGHGAGPTGEVSRAGPRGAATHQPGPDLSGHDRDARALHRGGPGWFRASQVPHVLRGAGRRAAAGAAHSARHHRLRARVVVGRAGRRRWQSY